MDYVAGVNCGFSLRYENDSNLSHAWSLPVSPIGVVAGLFYMAEASQFDGCQLQAAPGGRQTSSTSVSSLARYSKTTNSEVS